MSTAAISVIWSRRKLRKVGEGNHLDAEPEEFAVDARRTAEWVWAAHSTDQVPDFLARLGVSGTA